MKSLVAYAAIALAIAVPSAQKTSIPAPAKPAAAATRPTLFLIGDSTVRNGDATGSNLSLIHI